MLTESLCEAASEIPRRLPRHTHPECWRSASQPVPLRFYQYRVHFSYCIF
ncbi:hypothetical protein ACPOL_6457 [Acidisarcina polymorpha]|uniref:Uncharacterized protein n=1 Tax=Acidisarcina polymorpha TaxID=2211140 RepID=A0A2Z5G8V4_9BACT|nr:hypothetical protein ACPOL_6457 [Acidisarcina polymorpha]